MTIETVPVLLTDEQRNALKYIRRSSRTIATMMERNRIGFRCFAHLPAYRVAGRMMPTLVCENRAIANIADSILQAGVCSVEQWNSLAWRINHNAAKQHALCDEVLHRDQEGDKRSES
jgi:hypothetical protein